MRDLVVSTVLDLSTYNADGKFTKLMPHIRNMLFHYTDENGFVGIRSSGFIEPSNTERRGPRSFSVQHCGNYLGNVCLVDTTGVDDATLEERLFWGLGITSCQLLYLLFLKEQIKPHLIRHDYHVANGSLYIPQIEYGYHGKIAIEMVKTVALITCSS